MVAGNREMQKELKTKITKIIQRTHNVKSFRLDNKGGIDYEAGQFMSVILDEDKDFTRYLTISSSPTEKGYIEFTKKLTDSEFSKRLNAAKAGDEIKVKYPLGNFILQEGVKKIGFLSGGIGITPIRSMAKFACDSKLDVDMILLFGNRSTADIAFKEDFEAMQKECSGFKVVNILSQPESAWQDKKGHINAQIIKEEIPDCNDRKFYVCGPPLMVSGMKCMLKDELKLPEEHIMVENFIGY